MSRMTLLDQELWLGGGQSRTFPFGKSPESGYPPYNVELLAGPAGAPEVLRITLAVAGFSLGDLSITVENGQLVVRGQQSEEQEREFLYRGIAARKFKRSFGLASGVEVGKAELHNGLLAIELVRPAQDQRVRTVPIKTGGQISSRQRSVSAARLDGAKGLEESE
jgi:HSP20 family molecular chaperone IbpA